MFDSFLYSLYEGAGGKPSKWVSSVSVVPDSFGTIVTGDGGYSTVLNVRGMLTLPENTMMGLVSAIESELLTQLDKGCYCCFDFTNDPTAQHKTLDPFIKNMRSAAKDYGLDLDDIIKSRYNANKSFISSQETRIVLCTPPYFNNMSANDISLSDKKMEKAYEEAGVLSGVIRGRSDMLYAHESFVEAIMSLLSDHAVLAEIVGPHTVFSEARYELFPKKTHQDWKPHLLGDGIARSALTGKERKDIMNMVTPNIGEQIMVGDASSTGSDLHIGKKRYRLFSLKKPAATLEPFTKLHHLIGYKTPYKVRIRLAGGGLQSAAGLMVTLARTLRFASVKNRQITAAARDLNDWVEHSHGFVTSTRVLVATWGSSEEELNENSSKIEQAMTGWGKGSSRPDITDKIGRPLRTLMRMIPGVSAKPEGFPLPIPINEASWLLPLSKAGSPFKYGSLMCRTDTGVAYPIHLVSRQQTARVTLGFAPMRMGKSMFSNSRILSLCLSSGLANIPKVLIIDSGWSSSGLIDLLKHSVSDSRKDEFQHYRVTMDASKFSYNIFEIDFGLSLPRKDHSQFCVRMVTLFCTSLKEKTANGAVAGFIQSLVDYAFDYYSPYNNPKLYTLGLNKEIDDTLERIKESANTWYEVRDILFKIDSESLAMEAHGYASFTLPDLAVLTSDSRIALLYENTLVPETGEKVISYVFRALTETIKSYPILAHTTNFRPSKASVLALDLAEVTVPSSHPSDQKQSAIMFMLARWMGANKFYIEEDDAFKYSEKQCPSLYRDYITSQCREMELSVKEIIYDEYHRTGGHDAISSQVVVDIREGPKYNVGISLFSQRPADFSETIINLSTSVYIFGVGAGNDGVEVQRLFGLSDNTMQGIQNFCRKPDRGGSYVFCRLVTDHGFSEQLLRYSTGSLELWALSTTPTDNRVRNELYRQFGPQIARKVLANHYPGGSVEAEVEKRIEATDGSASSVIDDLIQELFNAINKKIIN